MRVTFVDEKLRLPVVANRLGLQIPGCYCYKKYAEAHLSCWPAAVLTRFSVFSVSAFRDDCDYCGLSLTSCMVVSIRFSASASRFSSWDICL